MIERIKKRLLALGEKTEKVSVVRPRLRGRTHNVIVIRPKNDIFTQAIFIMRDDYFSASALPQDELLRQAQEAAGVYVPPISPFDRKSNIVIGILSLLLAAETTIIFLYIL